MMLLRSTMKRRRSGYTSLKASTESSWMMPWPCARLGMFLREKGSPSRAAVMGRTLWALARSGAGRVHALQEVLAKEGGGAVVESWPHA